jgi:hypothetical protein
MELEDLHRLSIRRFCCILNLADADVDRARRDFEAARAEQ